MSQPTPKASCGHPLNCAMSGLSKRRRWGRTSGCGWRSGDLCRMDICLNLWKTSSMAARRNGTCFHSGDRHLHLVNDHDKETEPHLKHFLGVGIHLEAEGANGRPLLHLLFLFPKVRHLLRCRRLETEAIMIVKW